MSKARFEHRCDACGKRVMLGKHVPTKVATVEQAAAIAEFLADCGWSAWHEGGLEVCVGVPEWMRPSDVRLLVLTTANRVDEAGEVRE